MVERAIVAVSSRRLSGEQRLGKHLQELFVPHDPSENLKKLFNFLVSTYFKNIYSVSNNFLLFSFRN
jgi:hypothetical protein